MDVLGSLGYSAGGLLTREQLPHQAQEFQMARQVKISLRDGILRVKESCQDVGHLPDRRVNLEIKCLAFPL